MAVNITKTSFKGLAVPSRPIIIDNYKIYGILYDLRQEAMFMQIGEGTISEYIDLLVATEQFVKNGGTVSDDGRIWYLPDGIHSFSSAKAISSPTVKPINWLSISCKTVPTCFAIPNIPSFDGSFLQTDISPVIFPG